MLKKLEAKKEVLVKEIAHYTEKIKKAQDKMAVIDELIDDEKKFNEATTEVAEVEEAIDCENKDTDCEKSEELPSVSRISYAD